MKKILLTSSMVLVLMFGLLGKASISSAAVASVSAGSPQTITLPTSTVNLAGTATASSGSAIASYNWVETSGPATAAIATPTLASTAVSGLTAAGSYMFTLTATDNSTPTASTGSSTVTITVNHAPGVTVSAGSAQTIVLPTTSATLTGSATTSVSGSSIASYAWTQVSGPVTAVMSTPTLASTLVSGLSASGMYDFKLTATDTTSPTALTNSADVIVTVSSTTTQTAKVKSSLEINPNGGVNLTGTLVSNTAGVLVVKVWGIMFTVNTASANGNVNISSFAVGDSISVNGNLDSTAATPTINARVVHDVTMQNVASQLEKQNKSKAQKAFANGHDNGKGKSKGKGKGH